MCSSVLLCMAPTPLNWIELAVELGEVQADVASTLNELLEQCCLVLEVLSYYGKKN